MLNRLKWLDATAKIAAVFVGLGVSACGARDEQLPPVKSTKEVACTLPVAAPPVIGLCGGASCKPSVLVVRVEANGTVSKVTVQGPSTSEYKACLEAEVSKLSFAPAKTCAGDPVAADWKRELQAICDPA